MTGNRRLSDLSVEARKQLLEDFVGRQLSSDPKGLNATPERQHAIPESARNFSKFALYEQIQLQAKVADGLGLRSPFFHRHDGLAADETSIGGRTLHNFSSYNYLGLNGDPRVHDAAKEAIDRYGISASASRIVSGERPIHGELERQLATLHGVERALVFVSGYATNLAVLGTLFGPSDLIVCDRLSHNSILQGIKLSGATKRQFDHNSMRDLARILEAERQKFEKVLIVTEGLFSMDGDVCPLPELVEIKRRFGCLLMVDEAHSIGVLGKTGRGVHEHHKVPPMDVDIWMGTLSKTLSGCGGYIAGSHALIEMLRYFAGPFVYSVGMPLPVAAACLKSLEIMLEEPERVAQLHANGAYFLRAAKAEGLRTGRSEGHAITPVIVGGSADAVRMSMLLDEVNVNVQPIIYPAVEEKSARLRFFLSSCHTQAQMDKTVSLVRSCLNDVTSKGNV